MTGLINYKISLAIVCLFLPTKCTCFFFFAYFNKPLWKPGTELGLPAAAWCIPLYVHSPVSIILGTKRKHSPA